MSDPPRAKPDWYPDPYGRHELRYFDGTEWTEHVLNDDRQNVDPPTGAPPEVVGSPRPDEVREQVESAALDGPTFVGDGTILGEPILVVNQKAKLVELSNEYAIYDQAGTQLGAIRQVGQGKAKKALRAFGAVDQFLTHKLQVVDMSGNVVMQITRPAKLVKSRVMIQRGAGRDVGEVTQENVFGKIRFAYVVNGERVGGIKAENWHAWNFSLRDATDTEVARITKTFEGVAQTLFTTADNYVLHVHKPLDEPLRSLVVASALTVDTALKQDSRGLS